MSKKKTEAEMRAIAEMIKNMVKDWNEDEEKEPDPCENCEVHYCNDCPNWHDDEDENEDWDDEDEDDKDGDAFDDCNDRDYDCNQWSTEENKQIEDLSKFITSVGTVLGGNMGLLVFDKSNKKDMEKLAAIFGEYAKRLS